MIIVCFREVSCIVVVIAALCAGAGETTEERQDKKPHIVGLAVGCFDWCFPDFLHIASPCRDVRPFILSRIFSASCTSQVLIP